MVGKENTELPLPNLTYSRAEAEQKIIEQIEKGRIIRNWIINSEEDLKTARSKETKWSRYNIELLRRLFDNEAPAKEYINYGAASAFLPHNPTLSFWIDSFREYIDASIIRLESILERLELIPAPGGEHTLESFLGQRSPSLAQSLPLKRDIFIVHGHDDGAREGVARFVEKLGHKAIILEEQLNPGNTIIEHLENHTNVDFAIVILTPDDIGAPKESKEAGRPRARQNVILELGGFWSKIGRSKVCTLLKGDVELPSDWRGVGYVKMGSCPGWKIDLARRLKQAGIEIDMNKLLLQ